MDPRELTPATARSARLAGSSRLLPFNLPIFTSVVAATSPWNTSCPHPRPGATSCSSVPIDRLRQPSSWNSRTGTPEATDEGLIERQGRQELHPSDQVKGYTHYCQRFHSTV